MELAAWCANRPVPDTPVTAVVEGITSVTVPIEPVPNTPVGNTFASIARVPVPIAPGTRHSRNCLPSLYFQTQSVQTLGQRSGHYLLANNSQANPSYLNYTSNDRNPHLSSLFQTRSFPSSGFSMIDLRK